MDLNFLFKISQKYFQKPLKLRWKKKSPKEISKEKQGFEMQTKPHFMIWSMGMKKKGKLPKRYQNQIK